MSSRLPVRAVPSPNFGERAPGSRIEILLLHYTGMRSVAEACDRLRDPAAEVSCHYLVDSDGAIIAMVPEDKRAWHAGRGSWAGSGDVNSRSIGIEIHNPGHEHGYVPFPAIQMEAVRDLCRDILARHEIAPWNVLAHSDMAPDRKADPGELFDWGFLADSGIGLWVEPEPLQEDGAGGDEALLAPGDVGAAVLDLQRQLADYGYGVPLSGRFCALTRDVVMAFQRHFRPARVDGVADRSTRATLARLRAARAALLGSG